MTAKDWADSLSVPTESENLLVLAREWKAAKALANGSMQNWKWDFDQLLWSSMNLFDLFSMEDTGHGYAPTALIVTFWAKEPLGFGLSLHHLPGWAVQIPSRLAEISGSAPASDRYMGPTWSSVGHIREILVGVHWLWCFIGVQVYVLH